MAAADDDRLAILPAHHERFVALHIRASLFDLFGGCQDITLGDDVLFLGLLHHRPVEFDLGLHLRVLCDQLGRGQLDLVGSNGIETHGLEVRHRRPEPHRFGDGRRARLHRSDVEQSLRGDRHDAP